MEIGFDWLIAKVTKIGDLENNKYLLELSTGFIIFSDCSDLQDALPAQIWAVKTAPAPVEGSNGQMPTQLGRVLAAVKLEDAPRLVTLFNLDAMLYCDFLRENSGEVFLPEGRFQVKCEVPPGTVFKGLQGLTTVLIESAYKEN